VKELPDKERAQPKPEMGWVNDELAEVDRMA